MKKFMYAMVVALVGSPPVFAQSEDMNGDAEMSAESDAAKPAEAEGEVEAMTEEEAAQNDTEKAALGATGDEDAKPDE